MMISHLREKKGLILVYQQLGSLLESGIPFINALPLVAENLPDKQIKKRYLEMQNQIKNGSTIATAMLHLDPNLDPSLFSQPRIGAYLLHQSAHYQTHLASIQHLLAALRYPLLLFAMMTVSTLGYLIWGIPFLLDFYAQMNLALPAYLQFFIDIGKGFSHYGIGISLFVIGLGIWGWPRLKNKLSLLLKKSVMMDPIALLMWRLGTKLAHGQDFAKALAELDLQASEPKFKAARMHLEAGGPRGDFFRQAFSLNSYHAALLNQAQDQARLAAWLIQLANEKLASIQAMIEKRISWVTPICLVGMSTSLTIGFLMVMNPMIQLSSTLVK